jgi:hypothetical protein
MDVHVDKTRQHVHARGVDLVIGIARFAIRLHRQSRPTGLAHLRDAVVFDHDVHRAERRTAGAVDDRGAADHHLLVGAKALAGLARRGLAVERVAAAASLSEARLALRRRLWRLRPKADEREQNREHRNGGECLHVRSFNEESLLESPLRCGAPC